MKFNDRYDFECLHRLMCFPDMCHVRQLSSGDKKHILIRKFSTDFGYKRIEFVAPFKFGC